MLADEKAMSMRSSPFRTVGTLADLLLQRLGADECMKPHASRRRAGRAVYAAIATNERSAR